MGVDIRPVRGRLGRHRFVDFPFRVFGHDPSWVPPLRLSVQDRLSPKHPANAHQDTRLWLAYRDGRPVGRIGACIDRFFNEYQGVSWGWVGFFEAFDDAQVATALFDTACGWAAAQGAELCVGPASFTTNDELGLLVEGFEHSPYILTTQNPKYYERLWVDAGWQPAMDLWGWHAYRGEVGLSDRQRRTLDRLKAKAQVTIRSMRMDDFDAEVGRFFEVYNAAWSKNWGFAPMPEAEIRHLGKQLKQILDPELALVVEKAGGEPIAVSLTLPDANEIMRTIRSGRLLPIGWLKLLRGLPKVSQARVFALGVKPEHQTLALGPLLYGEILERLHAKPTIKGGEASWILATNDRMNSAMELMGAIRYKTWRLYQKDL
jgi:ribosomal protein S18 acetylase RimI-like enzyme